jgi:hypothetical protein|tara:strand:- start:148 stop:342 length:195 start_codon:yes stop_codon:yes gene_type:complete
VYTTPWEGSMREYEFKYDEGVSYETNFSEWYRMNCSERSEYKEELYNEREGKLVFDKMFKRYDK